MDYARRALNQRKYIPPHVEAAMNQHMQQRMPQNLKRYVDSGYVPAHAEKQINKYMQKSMPSHLKQYAGAYVEQKIMQPSLSAQPSTPGKAPGPTPDRLRLDHTGATGTVQYEAKFHNDLFKDKSGQQMPDSRPGGVIAPDAQTAAPQQPAESLSNSPEPDPHTGGYDFITDPPKPTRQWRLPGKSWPLRIIGAVILLILIVVSVNFLQGLFASKSINKPAMLSVLQDQQELLHLCANGITHTQGQQLLSTGDTNFALTTQATLITSHSQLLTYLANNHIKIKSKQLSLKIDSGADQQLLAAAQAGTYDSTFKQVVQTKMSAYQQDLRYAYGVTKGPKGQKLLSDDFNYSQLLTQQLKSPS